MLEATTVVTPARFEQGLRYADFIAKATVNRDKFELYYKDSSLSAEDISFFRKATEPTEWTREDTRAGGSLVR